VNLRPGSRQSLT